MLLAANVVLDNLDLYRAGLVTTITLTLWSFPIAFVVGIVVAGFRVSPVPPLRWAGAAWVEIERNTPLVVQLVIFYFGFTKLGIRYGAFPSGVIVIAAYTSAYVADVVRSGINTVAAGQAEAARALGLTFPQTLMLVVLPQALRSVVAPIGNVLIALLKNTSIIGGAISVHELTKVAHDLTTDTARPIPVFLAAGTAYLVLVLGVGYGIGALENKVAVKR